MLEHALAYVTALGWRVFPVHSILPDGTCDCSPPGQDCRRPRDAGKHPRTRNGLLDASDDEARVRAWWKEWPTANVGLRTGADAGAPGFWVLDVDPKNGGLESLAAVEAEHGPIPAGARVVTGGGGWHYYFHLDGGESIPTRIGLRPGLDVRGDGGYVVAPPSLHAAGRPYAWELGCTPAYAPRAPEWLLALVRAKRAAPSGGGEFAHPTGEAVDPELLEDLQAALPWIPADDRDQWLRVGMALKRGGEERGAPETFFNLWCWWARRSEKFDPADSRRVWTSIDERGADAVRLPAVFGMAQDAGWANPRASRPAPAVAAPFPAADVPLRPMPPLVGEPIPPHLLEVDGLLGLLCSWVNAITPDRQPVGALGASLAALGALYGRRVRTLTNLRTNLYVLLIGESGVGKDGARSALKAAMLEAGLAKWIGGEDWRSGQGMIEGLRRHPSLVYMVDEFGDVLASATDPRAPSYLRKILQVLKVLYSSAGGTLMPAESGSSEERGEPIPFPHACVLGTSTPGAFYEGLDARRLEDGLGNRFLVFPLDRTPVANPPADPSVPAAVREELARHEKATQGTGNIAVATGGRLAGCRVVGTEERAQALLEAFRASLREARATRAWHEGAIPPLWFRVAENAAKLALVRAVSRCPETPLVTEADAAWALELAQWSVRNLEGQLAVRAGDTPHAKAASALKLYLAERPGAWVPHHEALHASHLKARDFREVVETLADDGSLEVQGRVGQRGARYRVQVRD